MGPDGTTLPRQRAVAVDSASTDVPLALAGSSPAASGTRRLATCDQERAKRRDDLIAAHMALAARIARAFAGRGEELADLTQVSMLELVKAAGRFNPARGVPFDQYAYPCITGALKKHFRDNGWRLQVPRRMQELCLQTASAVPALTQLLGCTPTVADLAVYLEVSEKDIRDGMRSHLAYNTRSLNESVGDGDRAELGQRLGCLDENIEAMPDRHALRQYIARLPAREQRILWLRFEVGLSQREIAEQLGISQMHVSRMLGRVLELLKKRLTVDG
jgi:RNA polymerase sigma-B factor